MNLRRTVKRTSIVSAVLILALYGGVIGYFMYQEPALVYRTKGRVLPTMERLMPYVEAATIAADPALSGRIVKAPRPSSRWVYFLHGNSGNVSTCQQWQAAMNKIGINSFVLDYRGFGESKGMPSEQGLYQDAAAGYAYLIEQKGVKPSELVVYGHSLGATVAVDLAARLPVAGLIVEGAYTSLPNLAQERYPFLPVKWMMRNQFNAVEKIGNVNCPKLFMHAREDRTIPIYHGRALYEHAPQPKTFVELSGGHGNAIEVDATTALAALQRFLNSLALESQLSGSN